MTLFLVNQNLKKPKAFGVYCTIDDKKVALTIFFFVSCTTSRIQLTKNTITRQEKSCQSNFYIISQIFRCIEKIFHIPLRNTASQELTYPNVVRRKFFFIFEWSTLSAILINHLTIR